MGWKAAIVREPAASRGSSTGRMKAGQMAAGTAHARWGSTHWTVFVCLYIQWLHGCVSNKEQGRAFNFN